MQPGEELSLPLGCAGNCGRGTPTPCRWNLVVGALVTDATIVQYDGHPSWPNGDALWRFMDEQEVAVFGTGAAVLIAHKKDGLKPREYASLTKLRTILATGSPLPSDVFDWVYRDVKPEVWLASVSGGTDIASCFVACAPTLPVHAGEIQCAELGVAAYARRRSSARKPGDGWGKSGRPAALRMLRLRLHLRRTGGSPRRRGRSWNPLVAGSVRLGLP